MLIALGIMAGMGPARADEPLHTPYPVHKTGPSGDFTCKEPPKAVRDLEFTSVYTDRSDGLSHVDPDALEDYKEAVEPVRAMERFLDNTISGYVAGTENGAARASCAGRWLYRWAAGEALLGRVNAQGIAVRKWTLASLSSLYLQVRDDAAIPSAQKRIVDAWINLLAQTVRNDYSRDEDKHSLHNNHLYWAAWAVMISAVTLDDRALYDWAVGQYKAAIDQVADDGTLPLEMARKGKAFNYHVFATGPLVMMAETAAHNGADLYGYNKGAIHRLVDRIIMEMDTDYALMEKETGAKQDLTGTLNGGAFAWLAPYIARFPDKTDEKYAEEFAPLRQRRLGGDLGALYYP